MVPRPGKGQWRLRLLHKAFGISTNNALYFTHLRALPAWLGHSHGHDIAVIFLPSELQPRLGMELVGPISCVFIVANSLVAAPISKRGRRVCNIVVDGKPRAETGRREGAPFTSFLLSWLCQCIGREMPFVLWLGPATSVLTCFHTLKARVRSKVGITRSLRALQLIGRPTIDVPISKSV